MPILKGSDPKRYTALSLDPNDAPRGYEDQWMMNPYASFDYNHSWSQRLWEALGFRSRFDEYRDSMSANAREYQAQLLDKAHNEEYDSPMAQAQRERAAGINPDLAGIGAGESSPMVNDPNGPIEPGSHDFNQIASTAMNFGQTILNGFTSALGLASTVLNFGIQREDYQGKKINNFSGLVSSALNLVTNTIPPDDQSQLYWSENLDNISGSYFNKRQHKVFNNAISNFLASANVNRLRYRERQGQIEDARDYAIARGSEFNEPLAVLEEIVKPLSEAYDKIFKQQYYNQSKSLSNEGEYLGSIDSGLMAEAENSTSESAIHQKNVDAILNGAFEEILNKVKAYGDSNKPGAGFANVLLLVLNVMRANNFMPKMSFNRSSNSANNIIQN